jgi:hypothetical protein
MMQQYHQEIITTQAIHRDLMQVNKIDGAAYNKRQSLSEICNVGVILRWMECWIRQWISIRGGHEVNNAKNNVAMAIIISLIT